MKRLFKIEYFDEQFPGLADRVRQWFNEGVTTQQVAQRLFDEYGVTLSINAVCNFRSKRWAADRECIRQKKIELQAAIEVERARQIRQSMAFPLPGAMDESSQ